MSTASLSQSTPTPMPGHLSVSYYTDLGGAEKPLSRMSDRTFVSVSGAISHVTPVMIVVTGADGHTAFCSVSAETRSDYAASIRVGQAVMVRGLTRIQPDGSRVIDASAVHSLDRKVVLL